MVSQTINDYRQDEALAPTAARNLPRDPPYRMPPALMQVDPVIQQIMPPARGQCRPHGIQNASNAQ